MRYFAALGALAESDVGLEGGKCRHAPDATSSEKAEDQSGNRSVTHGDPAETD
jgi:hypothetical protein